MNYIPSELAIQRVMQDTGMDRLQAIRHLQARRAAQANNRRATAQHPWGKTASLA
jgi:hypothetical protein